LPGFMHNKGEPFRTTTAMAANNMYTVEEIFDTASKAPIMTPTVNESAGDPLKKDVFGLNLGSDYEVPDELIHGRESRTQGLFQYGCHVMGKSESLETIIAKVREFNAQRCKPPLTEHELEAEVFPGLHKFTAERDAQAPKAKAPVPTAPVAPGEVPTPPPEIKVISACDYVERYIQVSDGSRVIDTFGDGQYRIYKEAEFVKEKKGEVLNKKELAKTWLESPDRSICRGIVWEPGHPEFFSEDGFQFYNIYKPADIQPVSEDEYDATIAQKFLVHFEYMFPEKDSREHFLNWFAFTVRYPGVHIPWAPLIVSDDEGTGKGLMFQMLTRLVGTDNAGRIQLSDVERDFNDFLIGKAVILLDEMSKPSKQSTVDRLKLYISEDRVSINTKGIAIREHNIYGNMIIFSNNSDAAFMGAGDRRYWVHKMHTLATPDHFARVGGLFSHKVDGKRVYFDEHLSHFLTWINKRNLSKFNYLERPPTTESKREMIEDSRSQLDVELNDMIDHRVGIFGADIVAFSSILDALEPLNDKKLTNHEIAEVRRILNRRGSSVFCKYPLIPIQNTDNVQHKQYRVRCIRNDKHWQDQSVYELRHELTRSLQMIVVGNTNILPPKFDLVEGDRDAN